MHVIELRDPKALLIPDIQNLLRRAFDSVPMLTPYGFDSIAPDLFNFIVDDKQFMLLGAEGGKMKSVMLGYMPVGNLFPYPTLVLFYSEGSRQLAAEMRDQLLDLLASHGYTQMLAVNTSGYPDEVWLRGLRTEGVVSYIVGSLAMFEAE